MTYPTNQIPSVNPQNITISNPVGCEHNPRDPNAQDNTFPPGWEWQNTVSGNFFKCQSSTIAGAVWIPFAGAGAGTVVELTGNSGGPVGPDGGGNINVVGDSTTITIAGNPGTNTLTASLVGGGVASQSYVTNVSGPVSPTAAGVIDLNASTSTYTDGGTANTIKIELQGTNHALFVGKGVHTPASTIGTGTSGQALVSGGAGSDPAFGTLGVSGGGTGDVSFPAYTVITGGTISTGPLQNVSGLGTSGQVLTSSGAAALPVWATPTPIFIQRAAVSAGAITATIPGSIYSVFLLILNSIFPANNGDSILAQVSIDNGATYIAAGYLSGITGFPYNSTTAVNYNSTTGFIIAGAQHQSGAGAGVNGMLFFQTSAGTNGIVLNGTLSETDTNSSAFVNFTVGGEIGVVASVTNLQFTSPGGINGGSVSVYGFL